MAPKLRFGEIEIPKIAARYAYDQDDSSLSELRPGVQGRGCMNKDDLRKVAKWKSPRSAGNVEGENFSGSDFDDSTILRRPARGF
jgi:hypothetical protein